MKTRSYKELFKIMLDTGGKNYPGLCVLAAGLFGTNVITKEEYDKLHNYIIKNRPKKGKHYDKEYTAFIYDRAYYWPSYIWEPRRLWLLDQIKKYS